RGSGEAGRSIVAVAGACAGSQRCVWFARRGIEHRSRSARTSSLAREPLADRYELGPHRSQGLVDILDRILDKGLVIAGDVRIRLADVELLTIQIRLLVCSIDKADEIGMNWWR